MRVQVKSWLRVLVGVMVPFVVLASAHDGLSQDWRERTARNGTDAQRGNTPAFIRSEGAPDAETRTMADTQTVWNGSNDDVSAAANWLNGVPGSAADMVAIFDSTSQFSPQSSMDQSGVVNGFRVQSTPGFLADIGSDGNPYAPKPRNGQLLATIRGPGNTYLNPDGASAGMHVVIDCGTGFVQLDSGTTNSPTYQIVIVKSGNVQYKRTAVCTQILYVDGPTAVVEFLGPGAGFTALATAKLTLASGKVVCARDISTASEGFINVRGGEWWQTGLLPTECTVILGGGYFNYNPDGDPSGELPNLIVGPGAWFDASDYEDEIPMGFVIKARGGKISGTLVDQFKGTIDYDLEDLYPGG